jgi:hypothetical protein
MNLKQNLAIGAAAVVAIPALFALTMATYGTGPEQASNVADENARRAAYAKQLDADAATRDAGWYGRNTIKGMMRDPDSFKVTAAWSVHDGQAICYEYQSRNGFGGMNKGAALYDRQEAALYLREGGPAAFDVRWQALCLGRFTLLAM